MNFANLLEGQMLLFSFSLSSSHKIKKLHLTKPNPDVKNCLISELDLAFSG
jgi:hypothetical protein